MQRYNFKLAYTTHLKAGTSFYLKKLLPSLLSFNSIIEEAFFVFYKKKIKVITELKNSDDLSYSFFINLHRTDKKEIVSFSESYKKRVINYILASLGLLRNSEGLIGLLKALKGEEFLKYTEKK